MKLIYEESSQGTFEILYIRRAGKVNQAQKREMKALASLRRTLTMPTVEILIIYKHILKLKDK